jgi:hypothetical protein
MSEKKPVSRRVRIGGVLVPYDDAKRNVHLQRTVVDVLKATPGDNQNCMNSQCIRAQRNSNCFPHPVYVACTMKTVVYIIDKLTRSGEFAHAVRTIFPQRIPDLSRSTTNTALGRRVYLSYESLVTQRALRNALAMAAVDFRMVPATVRIREEEYRKEGSPSHQQVRCAVQGCGRCA